jgi:signal transduction histidine kinase
MPETLGVLQFFQLFLIVMLSSFTWHIMLKGKGSLDNLWLFGMLLLLLFNVTFSIVSYFPFTSDVFFAGTVIFLLMAALYLYSFPRSVWPNYSWAVIFGIIVTAGKIIFNRYSSDQYLAYFFVAVSFSVIFLIIIVRKIKYLKTNRKKAVILYASYVSSLSVLFALFSGFSAVLYDSSVFRIFILTILPVSIIGLIFAVYRNLNTQTGIHTSNILLLVIFSLPFTFLLSRLFEFRMIITRYLGTFHFSTGALIFLFLAVCLAGILVSVVSKVIEGFVSKNREIYQKLANDFRIGLEKVTTFDELFSYYKSTIRNEFPDVRHVLFVMITEDLDKGTFFDEDFFRSAIDLEVPATGNLLKETPYYVKTSIDVPPEILYLSDKYGGDVFIPVVFKTEIIGFMILYSRKISHNGLICIHNITANAITTIDKVLLFQAVIETEKQLEASRHFRETGKMVSFIAHELRSPLSSILFNMEVIKDNIVKNKDPDTEYLDISLREIRRLNEVVEKMLTYGRNIKLSPEKGVVAIFFEDISHLFQGIDHEIEFIDKTDGVEFNLDWNALKSVLINFITNSIQALERIDKAGFVKTTALLVKNNLIFEVEDNGPGIPDEHKDSIFEPFYTTRKEGNGLGLATCEKIVKLSGGRITLKSTSKEGSVFQLNIPIS